MNSGRRMSTVASTPSIPYRGTRYGPRSESIDPLSMRKEV